MRLNLICAIVILCATLILGIGWGADASSPCSSIGAVDFANRRFHMPGYGPVSLKNGKTFLSILPDDPSQKEWELTLEEEIAFEPEAGLAVKLIRLNQDHIAGTGSYDYLLGYECQGGQLKRIFESKDYKYRSKIRKLNEGTFSVRYGVWLEKDANCCPSNQNTDLYKWSAAKRTFLLVKRTQGPYKEEE